MHPTKQLKGTDAETGAWNTSAAKEYPPLMSAALARAMVDDACRHPINHKSNSHPSLFHFLAKYQPVLDPYIGDREAFGADYVDEALSVEDARSLMQKEGLSVVAITKNGQLHGAVDRDIILDFIKSY